MLNRAIPAFFADCLTHQYLLLLVKQNYLFVVIRGYFMKKVKLLFRVLCFFVDLLFDELQWPYFAPLSILLFRDWIADGQLFDPFFGYKFSKGYSNLGKQIHLILAAQHKINRLLNIDPLPDPLQMRIVFHSYLIGPQQFQGLAGILFPDRPNHKFFELKLDLILLRQILLYFYHYQKPVHHSQNTFPKFLVFQQKSHILVSTVYVLDKIIIMKEITQLNSTRNKEQIFYASVLSSFVSTFLTNPVEVAKLNYQYFPLSCKYYPHQNYIQLITCECSKFSLAGSIKSLKIAIPQVLFSNMIFMQLYEQSRESLISRSSLNSSQATFFSSIFARFVVVSLMIPFESLRIRFSNEIRNTKINFHGYKITMARDLMYSGLYWTMLESYRNQVSKGQYRQKIIENMAFTWKNFYLNMLPGFLFGMLTSAITTPMDTLKTRIQSQGITKYRILQGIIDIYKKQGLTGLFSGVEWRMLKSGLHSSLYLFIYEWYMRRVSFKHTYISGIED